VHCLIQSEVKIGKNTDFKFSTHSGVVQLFPYISFTDFNSTI